MFLRRSLIAVLAMVIVLAGCQIVNQRAGRGSQVNPPADPAPGRSVTTPSEAIAQTPEQPPTPIPSVLAKPKRRVSPIAGEPQIGVRIEQRSEPTLPTSCARYACRSSG